MSIPHDIPHRIERTKNRHSRAYLEQDTVVIRLAKNLSAMQEQEHINHLLGRMARYWRKEQQRTTIDPFRSLLDGASESIISIAEGGTYTFTLQPGTRNGKKQTRDGWQITVGPKTKKRALHHMLWRCLAESEAEIMDSRIREINNRTLKMHIPSTRIRYATSQWGSCAHDGRIMLNTALLFTDEELLNYVVVHELAHCIRKDHSKAFWNVVESVLPDYKAARDKLRHFRITPL
jgi:predicted metal-dependent hydrolase